MNGHDDAEVDGHDPSLPRSLARPAPRRTIGLVGRLVIGADAWSGIPEGLAQGLAAIGYDTLRVSAEPNRQARELVQAWLRRTGRMDPSWAQTPEMMVVRNVFVRARLLRPHRRSVSHWIVMGSDFGPPGRNFVTYDDMTVLAAVRSPGYVPLRPSVRDAWVRRQRLLYERARACCVASHWHADSLVNEYGVPRDKVRVVGFGVNIKGSDEDRDWTHPRYLFVGRDWERKNGRAVVEAFEHVRTVHPHATLDLVGEHPRVTGDGITDHGTLDLAAPADRRALGRLFGRATCFVMPSKFEPFGISYAEAGAAGVPSIATTVGGSRDAVGNGGLYVDPGDRMGLQRAMLELANPTRARELGALAHRHAGLLSWERVAARIASALGGPEVEPDLTSADC